MNTGTGCGIWGIVFWGQSQFGTTPINRVHDYLTKPRVIVIVPRSSTDIFIDRSNALTSSPRPLTYTNTDRPTINISRNRPRSVQ